MVRGLSNFPFVLPSRCLEITHSLTLCDLHRFPISCIPTLHIHAIYTPLILCDSPIVYITLFLCVSIVGDETILGSLDTVFLATLEMAQTIWAIFSQRLIWTSQLKLCLVAATKCAPCLRRKTSNAGLVYFQPLFFY